MVKNKRDSRLTKVHTKLNSGLMNIKKPTNNPAHKINICCKIEEVDTRNSETSFLLAI